jgi:hypothetical protein
LWKLRIFALANRTFERKIRVVEIFLKLGLQGEERDAQSVLGVFFWRATQYDVSKTIMPDCN